MEALFIQDSAEIPVRVSELAQKECGTWGGAMSSPKDIDLIKALSGRRGVLRFEDGREGAVTLLLDEKIGDLVPFVIIGDLIFDEQAEAV